MGRDMKKQFLIAILFALTLSTAACGKGGMFDAELPTAPDFNTNDPDIDTTIPVDIDGDGIPNDDDNCVAVANPDQSDQDNDGIGDLCEDDIDGDGIKNAEDNCPFAANTDQADNEADGIGDVCDNDDDNDGISDLTDNCPLDHNPDQGVSHFGGPFPADTIGANYMLSHNGARPIGDECNDDYNFDGVPNSGGALMVGDMQRRTDNCADYFSAEYCNWADPNDWDSDGVTNDIDSCVAISNGGAKQADIDGDGYGLGCDADIDGDFIINFTDNNNYLDDDIDGDGILNGAEATLYCVFDAGC